LLPSLNAFANYQHNFELPIFTIEFGGETQNFRAGSPENVTSGFQLQQPLFLGGSLWAGYGISSAATEMSANQAVLQKQNVVLQVRQAFYNTLYTQQLITVASEALANAQRNLDMVQKQADVGVASGFDLLRAKVAVANTRPQVIAAQHQHDQALTGLRTAIGIDSDTPIQVEGELTYEATVWADTTVQHLQQIAFERRLEVQNIEYQRSIQRRNLTIARASVLPSLTASSQLQYQLQSDELVFGGDEYFRSISGGLTLSIPLFSGGSSWAGIQEARVALRQVEDTERQVEHGIAAEVESSYYALIQSQEQYTSQQQTVQQAQESLRLAELRYREGSSTQLDVLNAQLALQQAQTNESQYLLQYNAARDQLLKAMNLLEFES
jgi:outer membrane protein TolC